MAKVSIIVPVYNVENYLRECLDSIVKQTLKDIEIICVNDVSPDNSYAILEEYAKSDTRIKIITHEKNQGLGLARNTGVSHATSPYIAFVDSDDYIALDMMEKLFELIVSNNAEMAWCGIAKVSETGALIDPGQIPAGIWTATGALNCEKLFPSIQTVTNKLFIREIIKEIKQLPILIEDEPAIAEYLSFCKKIVTTNESFYYYRKAPESLSNPSTHTPEYWKQFFSDYELYFSILRKNYPKPVVWKKQVILRHFSLLWRINTYCLLQSPSWEEQEKTIIFYLKKDGMKLKALCPAMFTYLLYSFNFNSSKKIKNQLFKIGLKLSRRVWVKRCSYWMLPFDMLRTKFPEMKSLIKKKLDYFEICFYRVIAKIYCSISKKSVWLIGERHDTAQENGLYFYRYLKTERPGVKSYYIIDKNSSQYEVVKRYGNIVQFNSLKHKILFFSSRYYVTAHNHFCFPVTFFGKKRIKLPNSAKNVFLDHGITYADVSELYGKMNSNINLFICGAKTEEEYVKKKFGYDTDEVAYTGFARFDGLHNFHREKQILVMPTWRKDIYFHLLNQSREVREISFKNTNYYKTFQRLINNKRLMKLLEQFQYQLFFYPHYEIQDYIELFTTKHNRVIIAPKNKYNVQDLLKCAALLITDTSSVHFDFSYMFKPLIYYRFDKDNFIKTHYNPGYFVHETMGFGKVVTKEHVLINTIENYLMNGCKMEKLYSDRVRTFYPLYDMNNCERIYKAIIER